MKNIFKSTALALIVLLTFNSCEKDVPVEVPIIIEDNSGVLEIKINATMNGLPVQGFTAFTNVNNHRATIEDFKFYLGEFKLKNPEGVSIDILGAAFFDLLNNLTSVKIKLPEGDYADLSFFVGVPDELNGTNNPDFSPSIYELDHPLSIYNGMYWTWSTGYIFLKVEGKIDTSTTQDQDFNRNYFYHVGLQNNFLPKEFPGTEIKINKGETTKLVFKIEYNDLFRNPTDTINMAVNSFTHTTDNMELAEKVITNFRDALTLE